MNEEKEQKKVMKLKEFVKEFLNQRIEVQSWEIFAIIIICFIGGLLFK